MGYSNGQTYPITFVRESCIIVRWEDRFGEGSKQFATVQELAEWLRTQPELAVCVGYVGKG